jgi:hypothetical protein
MGPEELAWTAGVIDGEGCITLGVTPIRKGQKRHSLGYCVKVDVASVDPRMVHRLQQLWGGHLYLHKTRQKPTHNFAWSWYILRDKAQDMLRRIRPYLVIKGEQADLVLQYRAGRSGPVRVTSEENVKRAALHHQLHVLKNRGAA